MTRLTRSLRGILEAATSAPRRPRTALLAVVASLALACDPTAPQQIVITDEPTLPAWSSLSANGSGACALTADGEAFCWGRREPSQCGPIGCVIDVIPTRVETVLRFTQIVLGAHERCAITASGDAYCWGSSINGATLGDGATGASATPVRIPFNSPVRSIAAAYNHSCAVIEDGTAYCWGSGFDELGDGSSVISFRVITTPAPVVTTLKFRSISAGTTQTCAITVSREAYCWGSGYGTLGIGARDTACASSPSCFIASTPQLVAGGLLWKAVHAGNAFTCGITVEDRGYCWGAVRLYGDPYPPTGVLGSGSFEGSKQPVGVAGGLPFRSIVTGVSWACGVTMDGDAYCWGSNEGAALGIGSSGGAYNAPQRVLGNLRFESLAAGEVTCGASVNHNLYCWGITTDGLLGNGVAAPGYRAVPTRVSAPAP